MSWNPLPLQFFPPNIFLPHNSHWDISPLDNVPHTNSPPDNVHFPPTLPLGQLSFTINGLLFCVFWLMQMWLSAPVKLTASKDLSPK